MIHNLIIIYFLDYLYKVRYNVRNMDVFFLKLNIDKYENPDVCFILSRMEETYKLIPVNPESFKKVDYGLYKLDLSQLYETVFFKNNVEKGTVRTYTSSNKISVKYNTFSGKTIRIDMPIEKIEQSVIDSTYNVILEIASLSENEKIYYINDIIELYNCLYMSKHNPNSVLALTDNNGEGEAKCIEVSDESQIGQMQIISKSSLENLFDFEHYFMLFGYGLSIFEKASAFFTVFNECPDWAVYSFYTEVDKEKIINYYSIAPIDKSFKITLKPQVEVEANSELEQVQVSGNIDKQENL
mgnify:CR=1 FL=1